MIRLSLVLRKVKASYEWIRKEFKLNHLIFMDDLKLFGKSVDQIDSLVQTVFTFSEDIDRHGIWSKWSGYSKERETCLMVFIYLTMKYGKSR